jgi:acetyl esterase/lipase
MATAAPTRVIAHLLLGLALAIPGALAAAADVPAGATTTLPLWSDPAPGETGTAKPETAVVDKKNVLIVGEVSVPTISLYPAPAATANGTAVVICPGGGYSILAMDLEGTEVASWLNGCGITAVILKYRVPKRANQPPYLAAVQDGQRALSLVRSKAQEWGIKPDRIGILGFSAGGHLAAMASTNAGNRLYAARDATDQVSCRPDFSVLIYPAYLVTDGKLNPELPVAADSPPAFLVFNGDDKLGPEQAIGYYLALKNHGVPAELHVYSKGGHGFGLRPTANPCSTWPERCREWLVVQGLIPAAK